jgi:hypothetical protein
MERTSWAAPVPSEEAQAPRIRLLRAALNALGTLLLAVAICWWAARGVSWEEVRAGLAAARPPVVIGALAVFTLSLFTVDVLGFGWSWRRHLEPDIRWSVVRTLVCGKQVFFGVLPVLTKVVGPLYFWRRRRLPPLQVLGASELISASDLTAVIFLVSVPLAISDVEIGSGLTASVAAWWLVVLAGMAWLRRAPRPGQRPSRLRDAALLRAFARATPSELASQVILRVAHHLITIGCLQVLLKEMGAALTPSQLLTFGPLFIFSCALPVSIAGYGGPQGLAVALLSSRWELLPAGHALAFSLIWSTGLMVLQVSVGLAHLPALLHLLRAPRRDG